MTIHDDTVVGNVALERARQDGKWGEQNHPDGTGGSTYPLADFAWAGHDGSTPRIVHKATALELANAARANCDSAARQHTVTWADILLEEVFEALAEDDEVRLVTELVQTAAVAEQWAAAILRRLDASTRTPREQP